MSLFSDETKRRINEYFPSLGNRPEGMGAGGLLGLIERMLSSTVNGKGASQIGVEDAGGDFTGTDVEAVLAELYTAATTAGSDAITDAPDYFTVDTVNGAFDALGSQIGGDDDNSFAFAEQNVLADDDAVYAALDKIDIQLGMVSHLTIPGTIGAPDAGTLNTTPIELVPAPGAGFWNEVHAVHWFYDYNSAAYDGTKTGQLMVKYTNGSGDELTGQVPETGFMDQTADVHRLVQSIDCIPAENAAVVAHASNDWFSAAGNSPVKFRVEYSVRKIDPTA